MAFLFIVKVTCYDRRDPYTWWSSFVALSRFSGSDELMRGGGVSWYFSGTSSSTREVCCSFFMALVVNHTRTGVLALLQSTHLGRRSIQQPHWRGLLMSTT